MTEATVAASPLRRRMIDDMSLRNLSPATQRSYLHVVTKFSRNFGRSPDCLGLEDVRAFQLHLVSLGISSGRSCVHWASFTASRWIGVRYLCGLCTRACRANCQRS